MPTLNDRGETIDDRWMIVRDAVAQRADIEQSANDIIVPLPYWLAHMDELRARSGRCGVWLAGDEEPLDLAASITQLPLVAVNFPAFNDGRGLSSAVLLRTRLKFTGDLRAIGDVRQDQLSYMRRCGFTTFAAADAAAAEQLRQGLFVMSDYYQGSVTEPTPMFRRRTRGAR